MTDPVALLQAISKVDPDAAVVYARAAALDVGEQAARDFKSALVPCMADVYRSAVPPIARSLGRDYISKAAAGTPPEFDPRLIGALKYALGGYELFAKALTTDWFTVNGARVEVMRDEQGRFARQSSAPQSAKNEGLLNRYYAPGSKPGKDIRASRILPEQFKGKVGGAENEKAKYEGEESQQKAVTFGMQALEQGEEFTQMLREANVLPRDESDPAAAGVADDTRRRIAVTAQVVSAADGSERTVDMEWDKESESYALPADYRLGFAITGIEAVPRNSNDREIAEALTQRQRYTHSFGSADSIASAAGRLGRSSSGDLDVNNLRRSSNMMGSAGDLLNTLGFRGAGAGAKSISAGLGALDNDDLRRSMTMTSHRFRGIEAPQVDGRLAAALGAKYDPRSERDTSRPVNTERRRYYEQTMPGEPVSDEAMGMGLQRDNASLVMLDRLKRRTAEAGLGTDLGSNDVNYDALAQKIARGIGRGMPSEGVLIDRKGRIVSQSMGVGSDHFVPFGAESIGRINGGQYIRTRQLGGFTGEDLRTLLIGNGRAAQVVSASGVYELELDPSLRGGRRYNDRALQMIDTYDRILDEVANGGLYATKLPPENEAKARDQAKRKGGSNPDNYQAALREARHEQYNALAAEGLDPAEEDAIRSRAYKQARAEFTERFGSKASMGRGSEPGSGRRSEAWVDPSINSRMQRYAEQKGQEAVDDAIKQKARMLTLNSEGYALALNMLKQYYPYMVRTARYRSNEEFKAQMEAGDKLDVTRSRMGSDDSWYTPVGNVRPSFPGVAGEGAKQEEAANARMGAPVNRAARRAYTGDFKAIVPGGRAPSSVPRAQAAQAGGSGGGPQPLVNADRSRSNLQAGIARAISTSKPFTSENEALAGTDIGSDEVLAKITAMPDAARAAMHLFGVSPDKAAGFLTSDMPSAALALAALGRPSVIEAVADETGNDPAKMQFVARGIDTMVASNALAGAEQVDPRVGDFSQLPKYEGRMMVPQVGSVTPSEVRQALGNPEIAAARNMLNASLAVKPGEELPLAMWDRVPKALQAAMSAINEESLSGSDIDNQSSDLGKMHILHQSQRMDAGELEVAVSAIKAYGDATGQKSGVLTEEGIGSVMSALALGAGVETLARLTGESEPVPKAPAPNRGGVGKSAGLTPLQRWIVDLDLPQRFK